MLPNLIKDHLDPERTVEAAIAAGVRAIEVSCRRTDTLALIRRLRQRFPELAVGVSSLVEEGPYFHFLQERGPRFPSIEEAVEAGAEFLVSYIAFSSATYQRYKHLPIVPGVETADEAKRQLDLGASLVKFSNTPAAKLKAINSAPIHSGLPLLVTGGVRPEHLSDFVAAGTLACVCGMDLILGDRYQALQRQFDPATVKACVGEYLAKFNEARSQHQPGADFASGNAQLIQRQTGQFMNLPTEAKQGEPQTSIAPGIV